MNDADRDEFIGLINSFEHSAWRWECQGVYHEPSEREPFQLWKEGQPDHSFMTGWCARVRGWRDEGKIFRRVRMLTDPLTEYLQWMLEFTDLNVDAGEDIRWMTEADARSLGAPTYDYYLLDDKLVVILEFSENGVSGAKIADDRAAITEAQRWRRVAWDHSTPHKEYMATRST